MRDSLKKYAETHLTRLRFHSREAERQPNSYINAWLINSVRSCVGLDGNTRGFVHVRDFSQLAFAELVYFLL